MDQGPLGEEDVVWVAVAAVLGDSVVGILLGVRVLQLDSGDRQTIDEERHVEGPAGVAGAVVQLTRNGQHVRVVLGERVNGQGVAGPEVGQVDLHAAVTHSLAQDVQDPARVYLGGETLCELALGGGLVAAVEANEPVPGLHLRRSDEPVHLASVDTELDVERALGFGPAAREQPGFYVGFEGVFGVGSAVAHTTLPGEERRRAVVTSSWPVTAAVMSAWRRSVRR